MVKMRETKKVTPYRPQSAGAVDQRPQTYQQPIADCLQERAKRELTEQLIKQVTWLAVLDMHHGVTFKEFTH